MKKAEGEKWAGYKRADIVQLERGKFFKEVAKGASVALIDPKPDRLPAHLAGESRLKASL